jgi:hypothetical protein
MSGPAVTYIASLIQSLFHRSTVLWLIREVHVCRAAEGGEACHSAQEQHTSRSMLTSGTGENGYLAMICRDVIEWMRLLRDAVLSEAVRGNGQRLGVDDQRLMMVG